MILRETNGTVQCNKPGVTVRRIINILNKFTDVRYNINNKIMINNYNINKNINRTLLNYLYVFICVNVLVIENCHGLPFVNNYNYNYKNTTSSSYDEQLTQLLNNNKTRVKRTPPYPDKLIRYLEDFGYLPESDREVGNLRSEKELKEAIKNMQAFANIPATGIMDKETVRLLGKARCGVADMQIQRNKRRKRYTIQGQKWHHTNITWSLQSRRLLSLDHGRVRKELYRALNVWSKHSLLNFQEVNSPNADILIYFERGNHNDGYPFDGKGKILAHAFFPGSGRGGDAHFDEDEIWQLEGDSNDVDGSTSLFAVAAHEFGHSLGLSHSSVKGALMYPWYQGLQENFELPEDDRYGIQQLYGARTKLWSEIPKYYPTDKGRQDPNKGGRDPYRGQYPGRPTPVNPPRYYPTPRTTTTTTTTTTPAPRVTPHPRGDKPDTCDSSYDAISVIRSETFIFKDRYMWRIGDEGLYKGYPVLIHRLWNKLPANLTHVDAVYERLDKKIVFFIGRQYYVFNTNNLEPGYPRPLTALGLPSTLDQIDAVMVWGHNSKTYFFAGTVYWRYDEEIKRVELDYPRDMRVWKGVGYYIDAVFQWKDGATYFFKGKGFWKFNDLRMRVESERQMLSSMFWMKCPQVESEKPKNGTDSNDVNDVNDDSSSGSKLGNLFILIYTLSLFLLIYNNASY